MTEETRSRVAVACQGGGSHTAFTAGVLDRLLAEPDPAYRIVALTGTSGGAICAFLVWYALASTDDEATGRERARALLAGVWDEIEADDPVTATANRVGVWLTRARESGAPVPQVSPYDSGVSGWTERYLRSALERAVPPAELARVVAAQREGRTGPSLHLGAVDVVRGTFRTFTERDVTVDAVLASAAIPSVFRAATVESGGEKRQYWDGLFSQNPPIRDLLAGRAAEEKPEEIWLVRINPQRRDAVPTSLEAIGDRRNELSGNLSVSQELAFVRRVNEWSARGYLPETYRPVAVRTIGLDGDDLASPRELTPASKLDCRPSFVAALTAAGDAAAGRFLAEERNRRLVRGTVDAVWNTANPAAGAYLADDVSLHATGRVGVGGDGDGDDPGVYEAYVERFRTALDGLSLRVESDVAADDRVAVVCTATGRHVGGLFGVEPSGEQVSIRLVQVARVAVDETGTAAVAEVWLSVDDAEIAWAVNDAETDDVRAPVPTTHSTPVVDDLAGTAEARSAGVSNAEGLWSGADVADRLVAENHVFRRAGTVVEGREAYVALVASYRAGFPDLQVTVRDVVAEGDRVVVRTTMTARHEGTFEGNEPTGRRVEAHWTFVHEVIDGRIVSTEVVGDHGWLLEQVSARPVSARATTDDPTGSTR